MIENADGYCNFIKDRIEESFFSDEKAALHKGLKFLGLSLKKYLLLCIQSFNSNEKNGESFPEFDLLTLPQKPIIKKIAGKFQKVTKGESGIKDDFIAVHLSLSFITFEYFRKNEALSLALEYAKYITRNIDRLEARIGSKPPLSIKNFRANMEWEITILEKEIKNNKSQPKSNFISKDDQKRYQESIHYLSSRNKSKLPIASAIQSTVHPINFAVLGGQNFERLAYAYLSTLKKWDRNLEWPGQSGTDGGIDIWGVLNGETFCYLCANYTALTFKKFKMDLDKLILNKTLPNHLIQVCGGKISAKLRSKIFLESKERGINSVEVWSGVEFEEQIRGNRPDLLKRFFEGELFPEDFNNILAVTDEITFSSIDYDLLRGKIEFPSDYIARKIIPLETFKVKDPFVIKAGVDIKEAIKRDKKIILLANGGVGKSTELKRLAFSFPQNELIPVFISLRSYTDEKIKDLLPQGWDKVPLKQLLLIIDGLDEVENKNLATAKRNLISFTQNFEDILILISCRTNFFDIPLEGIRDSLDNFFTPYYLENINIYSTEVKKYIADKYKIDPNKFIASINNNKYSDLVENPFYLNHIAKIYSENQNLDTNRGALFDQFITSDINFDTDKFNSSVDDMRLNKSKILSLLSRIALGFETMGRNELKIEETLEFISEDEFKLLRHSKSFKKKEGADNLWQFNHRLIQEYLAAKALSVLTFDKVISLLANGEGNKLIPSWLNTMTFLFNILKKGDELLKKLLPWILKNERETIVKIERDKVSEEIRREILKEIFNFYKKYNIWISSNKFNSKDLARFCQSDENIRFLISEIADENNSLIAKGNAVNIIGHFDYSNIQLKEEVKNVLLIQIELHQSNSSFVSSVIYALNSARMHQSSVMDSLMEKLGVRTNQDIRSAIYSLLREVENIEKYVDYIIAGHKIIRREVSGMSRGGDSDRPKISSANEDWNIKECIKKIKTPDGIRKLIIYCSESTWFSDGYYSDEILNTIIENAVTAYSSDRTVYDVMLNLLFSKCRNMDLEISRIVLSFFNETATREQAFYDVWNTEEDNLRSRSYTLAKLMTPEQFEFVINSYYKNEISEDQLKFIYADLFYAGDGMHTLFREFLNEKTTYKLIIPDKVDYGTVNKRKQQEGFNLLFEYKRFYKQTIEIFDFEKKDTFSIQELFGVKKQNNLDVEMDSYYSIASLRLLRSFTSENSNKIVSKKEVVEWFNNKKTVTWYCISHIRQYLENSKDITVSEKQKGWIKKWVFDNVKLINFRTAITDHGNGSFSVIPMAIPITYFFKRFNFDFEKETLLDMLSFDMRGSENSELFDLILSKLDKKEAADRIVSNISNGIPNDFILENHIKYAISNKLVEIYPHILKEINNRARKLYFREELLAIYAKGTNDVAGIKSLLSDAEENIKWKIIELLIKRDDDKFVISYLLELLDKDKTIIEPQRIFRFLISLQNIKGLENYVEWIRSNKISSLETNPLNDFTKLTKKEAVPYLIDLLEIGYQRNITVDHFDTLDLLHKSS